MRDTWFNRKVFDQWYRTRHLRARLRAAWGCLFGPMLACSTEPAPHATARLRAYQIGQDRRILEFVQIDESGSDLVGDIRPVGYALVNVRDMEAFDLARLLTPELDARHERARAASDAVHTLTYLTDIDPKVLRTAGNELDCGDDCHRRGGYCRRLEEGECGAWHCEQLHKLADAITLRDIIEAEKRQAAKSEEIAF